jgi:hypothetical protein
MNRRKSYAGFSFVALVVALAILVASVLAAAPQLHQRIHGAAQHECAVTLIASGKYDHTPANASAVTPYHGLSEATFLPDHLRVTTPVLEFSLLEHAPPSVS